jgi:hypothetical protein
LAAARQKRFAQQQALAAARQKGRLCKQQVYRKRTLRANAQAVACMVASVVLPSSSASDQTVLALVHVVLVLVLLVHCLAHVVLVLVLLVHCLAHTLLVLVHCLHLSGTSLIFVAVQSPLRAAANNQ